MLDLSLDPNEIVRNLSYLLVAYGLALPIGWDREKRARSAGLRTFPLVSVGACAFMLTGIALFGIGDPLARVVVGVVTGIGFIGGGAILKSGGTVRGTATAASIWNTGAVGLAVAVNRFEIALVLAVMNFLTLRYVPKLKERAGVGKDDED